MLEILQRLPLILQIKPKLLSVVCKALHDLLQIQVIPFSL